MFGLVVLSAIFANSTDFKGVYEKLFVLRFLFHARGRVTKYSNRLYDCMTEKLLLFLDTAKG